MTSAILAAYTEPVRIIRLTPFLSLLFGPLVASGQWEEATEAYLIEATTQASWLGCGMSLADFNLDGLEDLTFANSDGTVVLYEQMASGGFELVQTLPGTDQAQGVAWFDADGDDDLDLLLTRRFARIELHMNVAGNLVEEAPDRGFPINANWEGRGLSIADYDLDGDLDVYICLYHDGTGSTQQNLLFSNNGDGFFSDVTSIAGVGNGVQHSFQAIWFDYDEDGDDDIDIGSHIGLVFDDEEVFGKIVEFDDDEGTVTIEEDGTGDLVTGYQEDMFIE